MTIPMCVGPDRVLIRMRWVRGTGATQRTSSEPSTENVRFVAMADVRTVGTCERTDKSGQWRTQTRRKGSRHVSTGVKKILRGDRCVISNRGRFGVRHRPGAADSHLPPGFSPPGIHPRGSKRCKHVFCEKPSCVDADGLPCSVWRAHGRITRFAKRRHRDRDRTQYRPP